ncbi:uncharacterized protein CLUP02_01218 [Colletotrichum lupini]|uniref:Uncharacterized protein n=1 Tax=Colletotrichum lupini TaxID=145971 RepID=A0A9Q8SDK4_9PEZI|nr:uncharacterized protein CLUP02_01218 [Colletotrichum lupini]UQC74567.1 hypothetical protein CLUP02_01218 [Colletotrichum lupini]
MAGTWDFGAEPRGNTHEHTIPVVGRAAIWMVFKMTPSCANEYDEREEEEDGRVGTGWVKRDRKVLETRVLQCCLTASLFI